MALVTSKEIAEVIGLQKLGFLGTFIGWVLLRILRISAINKIYEKNKNKSDLDFLNGILDDCNIKFEDLLFLKELYDLAIDQEEKYFECVQNNYNLVLKNKADVSDQNILNSKLSYTFCLVNDNDFDGHWRRQHIYCGRD